MAISALNSHLWGHSLPIDCNLVDNGFRVRTRRQTHSPLMLCLTYIRINELNVYVIEI